MAQDAGDMAEENMIEIPADLLTINTQQLFFAEEQREEKCGRYKELVTPEILKQKVAEAIPKRTRENNKWAVGVWRDWVTWRNTQRETLRDDLYPISADICEMGVPKIAHWMCFFVLEVTRKDGKPYPPSTLMQICLSLQRHLRDSGVYVNLFKGSDSTFAHFRRAIDAKMKTLTSQGIGVTVAKADPVLPEEEEAMWKTGTFSFDTALGLSNAVFFYNYKALAFRGGLHEHMGLEAEQFVIGTDPANGKGYLKYQGRVSKNNQGGLDHRRVTPKCIQHYADPSNDRCFVRLYETYLKLIPANGLFYRKPLPPSDKFKYPRFSAAHLSQHEISCMFKKFYAMSGLDVGSRKITNHSGRVTCATQLYNAGFDNKAVTSRSYHRSNAVESYKRILQPKLEAISNTLAPPPKVSINPL